MNNTKILDFIINALISLLIIACYHVYYKSDTLDLTGVLAISDKSTIYEKAKGASPEELSKILDQYESEVKVFKNSGFIVLDGSSIIAAPKEYLIKHK